MFKFRKHRIHCDNWEDHSEALRPDTGVRDGQSLSWGVTDWVTFESEDLEFCYYTPTVGHVIKVDTFLFVNINWNIYTINTIFVSLKWFIFGFVVLWGMFTYVLIDAIYHRNEKHCT